MNSFFGFEFRVLSFGLIQFGTQNSKFKKNALTVIWTIVFVVWFLQCHTILAQCAYPDSRSAQWKPVWLTTQQPPSGKHHYYDKGYGTGETYEAALDHAIANISKKRELATGQIVTFVTGTAVAGNSQITVKARIEHEYWERCHDAVQRKQLYHVNILCVVANNPRDDISGVKTNKKYLKPDKK